MYRIKKGNNNQESKLNLTESASCTSPLHKQLEEHVGSSSVNCFLFFFSHKLSQRKTLVK